MAKKVNYKAVYCKFFGYAMTNDEFIPSEISGKQSCDLHHIHPKQMGGKTSFIHEGVEYGIDSIENLIALTREEHHEAHNGENQKETQLEMWRIHQEKIAGHRNVNRSRMNGK